MRASAGSAQERTPQANRGDSRIGRRYALSRRLRTRAIALGIAPYRYCDCLTGFDITPSMEPKASYAIAKYFGVGA
ncbi:MAG: hypothetical protein F6J93_38240 [Oscillatoria sp. SIO1A7]|nr:hypothetical protein [Oscillatoria sp. SIO1A7]